MGAYLLYITGLLGWQEMLVVAAICLFGYMLAISGYRMSRGDRFWEANTRRIAKMRTQEAAIDIATYMGMTEEEVMRQALVVFLQETDF